MSYDFYSLFRIINKEDVDKLTSGSDRYSEIKNPLLRIMLLNTVFGAGVEGNDRTELNVYAKVGERGVSSGLKALIHTNGSYNDALQCKLFELNLLGINQAIDIVTLPYATWLIEFPITLSKPFISRDDTPLYIIENPVRKDKVFGIPFTSAMAWKGNLRWTMMKKYLELRTDNPEEFAEIRFQHTLLFGAEKGMEEIAKGWTDYLDTLYPDAKEIYRQKLKEKFKSDEAPSLTGMLHFYPTFWDRIDMEVINPHDRKTKTGKNPIYYEVVPADAKGIFRLLYVPFYYLDYSKTDLIHIVLQDLESIAGGLKEMMLTYGFSAKKSSGYGVIQNSWDRKSSRLIINGISKALHFGNFEELSKEIKKLKMG